jgi:beta-lactamase class A
LDASLAELLRAAPGRWAWDARRLADGYRTAYRAEDIRPAASLIKLGILAAAWDRIERGAARLRDRLAWEPEEAVPGSGVLKDLVPSPWRLADLLTLMVTVSDNTAANVLLRWLGRDAVNHTMATLGMTRTVLANPFERLAVPRTGYNHTTARDMTELVQRMVMGTAISRAASQHMTDLLRRCQAPCAFAPAPRPLAPGVAATWPVVGHKTGRLDRLRADTGFVFGPTGGFVLTLIGDEAPAGRLGPWLFRFGRALVAHLERAPRVRQAL